VESLSVARRDGKQTMQARYSTDEGRTWSQPEDLFDFPRESGGFALFERLLDRDGEIHIFILGDANSGTLFPSAEEGAPVRQGEVLEIWHIKSTDQRKHWTAPTRICEQGDDLLSVIQMRSGRIVLPFSIRRLQDFNSPRHGFEGFTYEGSYGVSTLYSDDGGDTWQRSPDVLTVQTPDLGTYGADEPVVIELNDGRIWMLMRTQNGRFYESFSPDGVHWPPPTPSKLVSSDSPAAILRLKDGGILLFSNPCLRYPYAYGGRFVLQGAISHDEGRTWRGCREMFRDPRRNDPVDFRAGDYGISYSFPELTSQGNVLFTNWVETQNGRVRPFKLLDPAWLYQTRQETDFASGLDDWSIFGSKGVELQPDPSKANGQVLSIRKADTEWPASAVWNFPVGSTGTLKIKLMLRDGFGGLRLGLTDQFSVPWDQEDQFHNVFNVDIPANGEVASDNLTPNKWHDLQLKWDTNHRQCQISIDGKIAGVVNDDRHSDGVNYLRLHSTATSPDGGLLIGYVSADVSASWPQ
jgi:BNR repeat-like domain